MYSSGKEVQDINFFGSGNGIYTVGFDDGAFDENTVFETDNHQNENMLL